MAQEDPGSAQAGPGQDVFYRETLKALNRELATVSGQTLEHVRLTHKLCEAVDDLTLASREHARIAEQHVKIAQAQLEVLRDLKDEIALLRSDGNRRRGPTMTPPLSVSRTKTGG